MPGGSSARQNNKENYYCHGKKQEEYSPKVAFSYLQVNNILV
jgi:hypothetical protein